MNEKIEDGKNRILAVDDEAGIRDMLSFQLSNKGYQVDTAGDGLDALGKIKSADYALVISDFKMPKMNGIEMLELIKKSNPETEVLITTSYGSIETAVEAMKKGAGDFILKPFNYDEMLLVVEKMLERRKLKEKNKKLTLEIDQRKQVEKELRKARDEALKYAEAKAEFLAMMSHEIRTPMNAVVGMVDLLLNTNLSEEQKGYVEILKRGSDNLLALISDILDLSKIDSGEIEFESTPFSLQEFVEAAFEPAAEEARQKGIKFSYRLDPKLPKFLIGDPNRLRQICGHLLGNAVKFTEEGEVIFAVEPFMEGKDAETGKYKVHFSVIDTGVGVPAEKIEDIFDAFTQADSSTTRKYSGSGLGLCIAKKLTECMNGRIWVEKRKEKGSVFQLILPLQLVDID